MEVNRNKILGKIVYVGLWSTLLSLLLVFLYVYFAKAKYGNNAQQLNPGALAYGLTIFCNVGLSICALTSVLVVRRFFQFGWRRWCCWFLLPILFMLYVLIASSDGRPDIENSGVFLLMMCPWFCLWIKAYSTSSSKILLGPLILVFCLASCTSSGTRNDALVQQDTTGTSVDTLTSRITLSDGVVHNPDSAGRDIKRFETCQEPYGNMEDGITTLCFWHGYSLSEAYKAYRKKNSNNDDGKFLQDSLPTAARDTSFGDYPFAVTYTPDGADVLDIELSFPGGSTSIMFLQKDNGVEVRTVHSPD